MAIFASDDNDDTEYVTDYEPALIKLQGKAEILTPEKGVINRYGFPFSGSKVPGESIYDPAATNQPVSEVFISVNHDCPSKDFKDVGLEDWFHDAVDYVVEKGLMNGVSKDRFDPNGTTTRAMIVTILWRMEGTPHPSDPSDLPPSPQGEGEGFPDVETGSWYEAAVNWAAENGIVNGYSKTKFGPADPITREQFAAILYRYAQYKETPSQSASQTALPEGESLASTDEGSLDRFTDADQVSDWAAEAMNWCVASGIISGVTDTTLVPQGKSTRAQAATMLMRYCSME